jgi:hypothetical protein
MKRHLPWLALSNGDRDSTQILTQHNVAQYQTVSQVMSSGTTPSSKSPQFSPSGLLKCSRTGPMQMPHHNLTTQTEPQGYINLIIIKINNTYETWPLPEFSPQTRPRGLHSGYHRGISGQNSGAFGPTNFATKSCGSARCCI